jgi:hypothetical protein
LNKRSRNESFNNFQKYLSEVLILLGYHYTSTFKGLNDEKLGKLKRLEINSLENDDSEEENQGKSLRKSSKKNFFNFLNFNFHFRCITNTTQKTNFSFAFSNQKH